MLRPFCWLLPLPLLLCGCVDFSPELRRQSAQEMALAAGWEGIRLPAGEFVLAAFVPQHIAPADTLTVYIEGDGLAWITATEPSRDPTPMHATALEMALHQPHGAAAYLARPCQYVTGDDAHNCVRSWWTDARFALPVVASAGLAIDQLKQRFEAKRIVLVGYSGGGAIAALLAARRKDVFFLVTVAGNLDTDAWARLNKITPLTHSLNPSDVWQDLVDVPQVHFVGGRDHVVGEAVARSYQARFPKDRQPSLRVIGSFDHLCCWAAQWPTLYEW